MGWVSLKFGIGFNCALCMTAFMNVFISPGAQTRILFIIEETIFEQDMDGTVLVLENEKEFRVFDIEADVPEHEIWRTVNSFSIFDCLG